MSRNREYTRWQRRRTIKRKTNFLLRYSQLLYEGWTQGAPGRLAKGKMHCSCWMCRTKSYDYLSLSDLRKAADAKQQLEEARKGLN